jgi:hypothetical protein
MLDPADRALALWEGGTLKSVLFLISLRCIQTSLSGANASSWQ